MGYKVTVLNQRRALEKMGALFGIAEGDYEFLRTSMLKTTHCIRGDADLTEAVKELFRGHLLRSLKVRRAGPIWGHI